MIIMKSFSPASFFDLFYSTEVTSVEQLPLPKPVVKAPLTEAAMPKSNRPEVRIADQIAIRSFVLSHKLPKIGKQGRPSLFRLEF